MLRKVLYSLLGVVALLAVVVGGVAGWVWTTLPQVNGSIAVRGLDAPVEILRDRAGVPHILAKSARDAYFALGFVHAQDRFWQMEAMRRLGAGRLAEVLGPKAVASDKWMRTLGLYKLAEQQFRELSEPVQAALNVYAAGVNAQLEESRKWPWRTPAVEFTLLRYRPQPWKPADSLVWAKIMASRLGGNWQDEVLRARMARKLAPQQVGQLWPVYPDDGPNTVGKLAELTRELDLGKLAAASPEPAGTPHGASNAWAVTRQHTTTRAPLLANDPHLALSAPILWYLARLKAADLDVVGATAPGMPFTVLGHNARIAWGVTSTHSDIQDLFVEQIDADGKQYRAPDGMKPFDSETQTIAVKGADPVKITIRRSRHGPVVSDVVGAIGKVAGKEAAIALAATFFEPKDTTVEALYKLNRAQNWDGFLAALRDWRAPQSNFVFADTAGNIGFVAPGLVPVRKKGWGLVPSPGWDGATDWNGFVPFDELPRIYNPAGGRIVNANNRITPDDYPHFITTDWAPPYRAERILDRLKAQSQSPLTTGQLQRDDISEMARRILPLLLEVEAIGDMAKAIHARLQKWNGAMSRHRPEPLMFSTWLLELNRAIYGDELGELADDYLDLRPEFIHSVLTRHQQWCDDVRTPEPEDCRGRIQLALKRTVEGLVARHGSNPSQWQWGRVHAAHFRNPVLGGLPWIGGLAEIDIGSDGGNYTVNRGASRVSDPNYPFRHVHGAGYRGIYDLSDLRTSRFVIATGQSGNPFSSHYRDQLDDWLEGRFISLAPAVAALKSANAPTLVLTPAAGR